ncbi:hypothetical protein [Paenibacillus sp.]|uniref:hypothetical protein n=1 Tax=Paenibacillus sp. TaxID=58172 RepID=UPI002D68CFA4|nr:hypothetical protein [Paenibacillus sp.]HZG57090.1 hypothetical protein [Paenibacillus sp.]
MELMSYVAEYKAAEQHAYLEEKARLARLAKTDAARRSKQRSFAITLWNIEVTIRTVRKTAKA